MSALMHPTQLAQHLNTSAYEVTKAITAAKLKPLYETPQGRGTLKLYDVAQVEQAWKDYQASLLPQVIHVQVPAPASDVPWHELTERQAVTQGAVEILRENLAQLGAQNALLLKAIEKVGIELAAKVNALQETVEQHMPRQVIQLVPGPVVPPPAAPVKVAAPVATPSSPPKRKVAIVGLLPSQKSVIEHEFGDAFNLRFFQSEDAKGKGFQDAVGRCDTVLAMINFINHGISDTVKAAGKRLVHVNGGISSLKDKLTELYAVGEPA